MRALALWVLLAWLPMAAAGEPNAVLYAFEQEIPLAGDSHWDYLSIDPGARRLYVAHGDHIDVLDIDRNAVVGRIADTPGVHGFAIAAELARGYASDGQAARLSVVDLGSLRTLANVDTAANPDAVVFEPLRREVYAFNGKAHSVTVVDARDNRVVATIGLPGKPEFAVADPQAGRVYDNIEDQNLVVAIDVRTHAIVARWPIAPGENATGMALDSAHHRLFIGCRNQRLLMLDTDSGQVLASLPIERGVDANVFDPQTQLLFSANGEGTVSIVRVQGSDHLTLLQTLPTRAGARTMAVDPSSHRVYVASGGPGGVSILVYAPRAAR
jgi:DNA-binding beta-propeller fold protein YncE